MSGADDVLAAIDRALHDTSVSDDAMRWTPKLVDNPKPDTPAGPIQYASAGRGGRTSFTGNDVSPSGNGWTHGVRTSWDAHWVVPNIYPPLRGTRRYLFIGGPIHGYVMPVFDDMQVWNVFGINVDDPTIYSYQRRRYFNDHTDQQLQLWVYEYGNPGLRSIEAIVECLRYWERAGWRPDMERYDNAHS